MRWGGGLTCLHVNVVSSTALVLRHSRDQSSVAAHRLGGISQTLVAAVTAVVIRQFSVQHPAAANLVAFISLTKHIGRTLKQVSSSAIKGLEILALYSYPLDQ